MAQFSDCSDYCPYEPPIALWELVENYVPPHERQEIRKMLGESLVEQSLELHQEVNTLLEIWRDYRDETEDFLTRNRLPEPPAARERLKQEIKFFVNSIREKAKDNGTDASKVLDKHKTDVIEYALDTERTSSSGYGSRPSTAAGSSRDGRETPMMRVTPANERVSSLSDEVVAINDKLTYLKVDEVVLHLRDTLEQEVTQLMSDIEFLQGCLDSEADLRSNSRSGSREPTLTDLREERSKLEKDLLSDVTAITPAFKSNTSPTKKEAHFRPLPPSITPKSGLSKQQASANSKKSSSPIKAVHNITPVSSNHRTKLTQTSVKKVAFGSTGSIPKATGDSLNNTNPQSLNREHSGSSDITSSQVPSSQAAASRGHVRSYRVPSEGSQVTLKAKSHDQSKVVGDYKSETVPSPPSSAKPSRPNSAQRFRRMVIECRDEP